MYHARKQFKDLVPMRKVEYSLIGIVAVFTAVVLPVFNEGHTMDFGNTSEIANVMCNIAIASAAVYAAKNAKDWLSPKLNERKFKFADELIDNFCMLQQEALYLISDAKQIINTDPEIQGDADKFRKRWNAIYERVIIYRKNTINLQTIMERIDLWGLQPKNIDEFNNIIDSHLFLSYTIGDALSVGADETSLRQKNSYEYDKQISEKYKAVRVSHNKIMKHYSMLFID